MLLLETVRRWVLPSWFEKFRSSLSVYITWALLPLGSAASAKMPDKRQIVASSVGNISALLGVAIIVELCLLIQMMVKIRCWAFRSQSLALGVEECLLMHIRFERGRVPGKNGLKKQFLRNFFVLRHLLSCFKFSEMSQKTYTRLSIRKLVESQTGTELLASFL